MRGDLIAEMRCGSARLRIPSGHFHFFYATYFAGEYDDLQIRPGDFVLDAGAGLGDFTVKAAQEVGRAGRVVAVEPDPDQIKLLRQNLSLNGLTNVDVCEARLGRADSSDIAVPTQGESNHRAGGGTFQFAASTTIDEVLRNVGLKQFDIVKMDIEGSELEALERQKFLGSVREIAIELHGQPVITDTLRLLEDGGFVLRRLTAATLSYHSVRNIGLHPISFARAELTSRGYALRNALAQFLGPSPIPALRTGANVELWYGRRRPAGNRKSEN